MNKKIVKQFFPEAVKRVKENKCPFCGKDINILDFKNGLSIDEYYISGLCQECQDKTFK